MEAEPQKCSKEFYFEQHPGDLSNPHLWGSLLFRIPFPGTVLRTITQSHARPLCWAPLHLGRLRDPLLPALPLPGPWLMAGAPGAQKWKERSRDASVPPPLSPCSALEVVQASTVAAHWGPVLHRPRLC